MVNNTATLPTHSADEQMSQSLTLPGDVAMWFFILAELTVFALFFIGFAVAENNNALMFQDGKAQLHKIAGLINTIALIISSFFVAKAVQAMHLQKVQQAIHHLAFALVFALVYIVVKLWEYQALFEQGIDIETNTFFMLYFLITAFHFMHILLGIVILVFIAVNASKGRYTANATINISNASKSKTHIAQRQENSLAGFESGACYWHMVDLLWIILFPLIYVI